MINSFKQKDGRVGVMLWGSITKEPQMKETKNGDSMAWFYVRYGFEPIKNPNDRPSGKSIRVVAYKDVADICRNLEAWEGVFICGELKESEYNGKKEFNVIADIVLAPNAQIAAINALNAVRNMKRNVPNSGPEGISNGEDDAFSEVTQEDIDEIFPGL